MPDVIDPNKTKEAGGDTPPATPQPGDGNPLFAALFASADKKPAPEKKEDGADDRPDHPHTGRSLNGILNEGDEEEKKKKDGAADPAKDDAKKKDEPKAGDDKKKDDAAKPAAPVKLTRKMKKEADAAAPVATAPAAKKDEPKDTEKPGAKFEDALEPEEQQQIAMLRFAEKNLGDAYKGRADKMLAFFEKHAKFIETKKAEDPEYDFSDDNPEYRAWKKTNMPPLLKQVERDNIIKEQAKEEMRIETDAKLARQREETEVKERIPQVKKTADAFFSEVNDYAMPDNMKAVFKDKGADELRKQFPDEYEILEEVTNEMTNGAEEFMAITQGLKKFDPANRTHVGLDSFINFQCEDFAKNGGEYRTKDGKQFVTRAQFGAMAPAQRSTHWTFGEKDVLGLLKESAKITSEIKIKTHFEKLEKRGWKRGGATPVTTAKVEEEPSGKAKPAPTQGGDGKDDPKPANAVFKYLGL